MQGLVVWNDDERTSPSSEGTRETHLRQPGLSERPAGGDVIKVEVSQRAA